MYCMLDIRMIQYLFIARNFVVAEHMNYNMELTVNSS